MSELTPRDREVLEAYQETEQARVWHASNDVKFEGNRLDPDPRDVPEDQPPAGWGWNDSILVRNAPRRRQLPAMLGPAFLLGLGFVLGLVFARVTFATAPRPAQAIPSAGGTSGETTPGRTGAPSARALGGAPSPSVEAEPVPSPRPTGGIGQPLCSPAPCPTATPRPTAKPATPTPRSYTKPGQTQTGIASWFDSYGHGLYGAVHSWRFGNRPYPVTVCAGSRCVTVTIRDFCACPRRLIDLSRDAFARLADPSRGLVRVTVEGIR